MEKILISVSTVQKEMFTPKKYKVGPGSIDFGKDYEIRVTALLALRCCSEDLEHFWLASNVDGFGALDDIIMFKKTKQDDQGTTYLIQLKHQDASKPIVKNMFLSTKGNYSLKKYSESYIKMKSTIDDKKQQSDIFDHFRQTNKMVFIIFTNKGTNEDSQFLRKVNNATQLDSVRVKGNIYEFDHQTLSYINMEFLKDLFLFTNQPHFKDLDYEIKNTIKDLLKPLQIEEDEDLRGIAHKFVSFVGEWLKGLLCGHYPLTKTHILKKLTELVLLPYTYKLQELKEKYNDKEEDKEKNETNGENKEENEEENIWYNLTRDKDVTIIDDVDKMVERYVNDSTYSMLSNKNILDPVTTINKQLLRIVSNPRNMSKSDKYELLWKTRKIPLLLEVCDSQGIKHIREILCKFSKVFRVVIFNKTTFHLENLQNSNLFTNITDLNEKYQEIILQLPVKLQGRELTSIRKLNMDKGQFHESLKVKDIVQILCGQFNIGGEFEEIPKFFVKMSLTRIILDIKVLEKVPQDIFVVKCESFRNFKSILTRQLAFSEDQIIQWGYLNKNNFEGKVIIFDLTENLNEIEEFCLTLQKTVHFLVWHDKENLEWIKSNNTIENLRHYKKPTESTAIEFTSGKEALINICQYKKPLLVSANPGMGKSVLINYFSRNVPTNLWVLKVNLAKHKNLYKNWNRQNYNSQELKYQYFEQFVKEVLNEQQLCNAMVSDLVFKQYLKLKNVILLLDGFDEVPVSCQNGAKELIRFINESGYYVCVTTRPVLKKDLESVLNTFAVTLNSFTMDEQMYFLTNYFANSSDIRASDHKVILFVTKLLEAARRNLNDIDNRFTGIPLQATLLAEVFANDFIKYLEDDIFKNQYFDLIYLYKHFVNEKIKIAFIKIESISEDMINQYKLCRSYYALRHLFSNTDLEELKIDDKLKTVTELLSHTMQIIQKDGIIVTDSDSNVTFVHQTFAEFLAADWLAENINTSYKAIVQKLIKKTFEPSFLVVRNMFDRILALNCPLHIAIINRQINTVEKKIISDENALLATDDGGRTILHLIAAWGLHHPDDSNIFLGAESQQDEMMIIMKLIPNNKLTHVQDHLLNYTPLDYAVLSRSLRVADRICLNIKNPNCYINITKAEADNIFYYVNKYYSVSLYMVILRCHVRTDFDSHFQNEDDTINAHKVISQANIFISSDNINIKDRNGCTPLHSAANYGNTEIMRYLLSRKANVNQRDNKGRSALHWASYRGHLDIVSLLITNRVKVRTKDRYNRTALQYALISSPTNQCDIASMLIGNNKSNLSRISNPFNAVLKKTGKLFSAVRKTTNFVDIKDHNQMNALHWAAQSGQTAIIDLLLSKTINVNVESNFKMTALHFAVQNNHIDTINVLLRNGANIEAKDTRFQTPLHLAALYGLDGVVGVLLNSGADIEAKCEYHQTPLHVAAREGHKDVVSVLLENGTDIEAKDSYDRTALCVAVRWGHKDVVRVLLNNGAEIKAKDNYDRTPMYVAVRWGHKDVVNMLLNNGAEIQAKDNDDIALLHVAAQKGHEDVVSELLNNGAEIEVRDKNDKTPLHVAAQEGHKDVISVLFINGAQIEAKDKDGQTPLHLAALRGNTDEMSVLLNNGAEIEAKDKDDQTPLHVAALRGNKDIISVLLNNGAEIEAKDSNNQTPLHVAAQEGHKDVVSVLLINGAEIDVKDKDDKTPLHVAAQEGYKDIVSVLFNHSAGIEVKTKMIDLPFTWLHFGEIKT